MERAARARGKGSRIRRWETVQFTWSASGTGKGLLGISSAYPPSLRDRVYHMLQGIVSFEEPSLPDLGSLPSLKQLVSIQKSRPNDRVLPN